METLRAYAWFSPYPGRGGMLDVPPRAAVRAMLAQLEREIRARRAQPVSLSCERWPASAFGDAGDKRYLACIAIAIEPGGIERPLISWFEWQHSRWRSPAAPPLLGPWPTILDIKPNAEASP